MAYVARKIKGDAEDTVEKVELEEGVLDKPVTSNVFAVGFRLLRP